MPTTESSTSVSLLQRASRFDGDAWVRFVRIYSPLIYQWCRQADLQPTDIEDVAQEVFRAVLRGLREYVDARPAKFRAWLWGVTRNKVSDHYRRLGKAPPAVGGESAAERISQAPQSPSTDSSGSFVADDNLVIQRTLDLLREEFEPHTWQAFWRSTVGEERAAAIAADLNMTTKAVRQAKYRVLRRLRQELNLGNDPPTE